MATATAAVAAAADLVRWLPDGGARGTEPGSWLMNMNVDKLTLYYNSPLGNPVFRAGSRKGTQPVRASNVSSFK